MEKRDYVVGHAPRERMYELLAAADLGAKPRATQEEFDAVMVLSHRIVRAIPIRPAPSAFPDPRVLGP